MELKQIEASELTKKFGSYYRFSFHKNNTEFDHELRSKYLSKILGKYCAWDKKNPNRYINTETLDLFLKLKFEPQYYVKELIGTRSINDWYIEHDTYESALSATRQELNKLIEKLKARLVPPTLYIRAIDYLYKKNRLMFNKNEYADYVVIRKAIEDLSIDDIPLELKKSDYKMMPEKLPEIGQQLWCVSFSLDPKPCIIEMKVKSIDLYDFGPEERKVLFTIHCESEDGKKFDIDYDRFVQSDGETIKSGMAGYLYFSNREKAVDYLDRILTKYMDLITSVKNENKQRGQGA